MQVDNLLAAQGVKRKSPEDDEPAFTVVSHIPAPKSASPLGHVSHVMHPLATQQQKPDVELVAVLLEKTPVHTTLRLVQPQSTGADSHRNMLCLHERFYEFILSLSGKL